MTTRLLIAPADSDLGVEADAGSSSTLVLSRRAISRRSLYGASGDAAAWVARRRQEPSGWSADPQDGSSATAGSYLTVRAPSASWIDQYGAAAHYAFYAHVLASPSYTSFSAYA
jgi:hypothetical protein